jgi:ketosteroid isomerase-like protein
MSQTNPTLSDGDVVRAFFDAYSDQAPERFAGVVAEDYLDFGHEPPGRGPQVARDDYDAATKTVGAIRYEIDALVEDGDGGVAVVWTAQLPGSHEPFRGLGLYRVRNHLLAATHHAVVGPIPKLLQEIGST